MPITQSRMIAIIEAAQDYREALERLIRAIRSEYSRAESREITSGQALSNIEQYLSIPHLLNNPVGTIESLAIESAHFNKSTITRNNRVADKQRLHRAPFAKYRSPTLPAARPGPLANRPVRLYDQSTAPQTLVPTVISPATSTLDQAQRAAMQASADQADENDEGLIGLAELTADQQKDSQNSPSQNSPPNDTRLIDSQSARSHLSAEAVKLKNLNLDGKLPVPSNVQATYGIAGITGTSSSTSINQDSPKPTEYRQHLMSERGMIPPDD